MVSPLNNSALTQRNSFVIRTSRSDVVRLDWVSLASQSYCYANFKSAYHTLRILMCWDVDGS